MTDCSHGAKCEKRANRAAANRLIPEDELERFIQKFDPFYSVQAILGLAASLRIHPGIVVGQLQHRELIPWSSLNALKAKIRDVIIPTSVSDGFRHLSK